MMPQISRIITIKQLAILENIIFSIMHWGMHFNAQILFHLHSVVAIKGTPTVRECGPHPHCADHTPHSKPKKVRTRTVIRTVIRTSKCAVQMTTNPEKFIKKKFWKKNSKFFSNFLGLVVIWTAHLGVRITVRVRSSAHLLSSVWVRVRTTHQNEVCGWLLVSTALVP